MNERNAYSRFINAIRKAGNLPISPNTLNNDKVAKWAYNVALTRFEEIWQPSRQKLIAPLADLVRAWCWFCLLAWLLYTVSMNIPQPYFTFHVINMYSSITARVLTSKSHLIMMEIVLWRHWRISPPTRNLPSRMEILPIQHQSLPNTDSYRMIVKQSFARRYIWNLSLRRWIITSTIC